MTPGVASLPADLRVLELDDNQAKASFANMLLIVWRKDTTLAAYQRVGTLILELSRAHPDGVGVLQVVERGATPPDTETRSEFLRVLSVAEGHVKHYSVAHPGSGFSAAIFRAVMLGAYTYVRPKFEHKVFESLWDAATWHVEQQERIRPTSMTPATLMKAMEALRSEARRVATQPPKA